MTREEGDSKFQTQKGRAEIKKFYADIFKEPETIKSRNTVEYAKLLFEGGNGWLERFPSV